MNNAKEWHKLLKERDLKNLEKLLHKDAVFHSPLVFKPQEGRKLTALYLKNAAKMFFANGNTSFHYVREIHSEDHSMLEFTCEIEGILINGVDIISWDGEGKITEFKVMIRPNKAIEKVKEKMSELMSEISTMDKLKLKAAMAMDRLKK